MTWHSLSEALFASLLSLLCSDDGLLLGQSIYTPHTHHDNEEMKEEEEEYTDDYRSARVPRRPPRCSVCVCVCVCVCLCVFMISSRLILSQCKTCGECCRVGEADCTACMTFYCSDCMKTCLRCGRFFCPQCVLIFCAHCVNPKCVFLSERIERHCEKEGEVKREERREKSEISFSH